MTNFPPPPPTKQGLPTLAKVGLGCVALIILVGLVGVGLVMKYGPALSKAVSEAQKYPVATAANIAIHADPNLEVVKADEVTKEITIRNKKSQQVVTMNLDELLHGKFSAQDSDGNAVVVDPNNPQGEVKISKKDGSTIIGGQGAATALPNWFPAYPGATALPGGIKSDNGDRTSGMAQFETVDNMAKVKDFYVGKLVTAGFKTETPTISADTGMISASNDTAKQQASVTITSEGGKSRVVVTYEGPK